MTKTKKKTTKTKMVETVLLAISALLTAAKAVVKFIQYISKLRTKTEESC